MLQGSSNSLNQSCLRRELIAWGLLGGLGNNVSKISQIERLKSASRWTRLFNFALKMTVDPFDDIIQQLTKLNIRPESPHIVVLDVDRSQSYRGNHPLSSTPGGSYTVLQYDKRGQYIKAYHNIHSPQSYMAAIKRKDPGCILRAIPTSSYLRHRWGRRGDLE